MALAHIFYFFDGGTLFVLRTFCIFIWTGSNVSVQQATILDICSNGLDIYGKEAWTLFVNTRHGRTINQIYFHVLNLKLYKPCVKYLGSELEVPQPLGYLTTAWLHIPLQSPTSITCS